MPTNHLYLSSALRRTHFLVHVIMDFLKSAVASAIAKGSSFPYSLGDRVDVTDSIWALHNATKRVCALDCDAGFKLMLITRYA